MTALETVSPMRDESRNSSAASLDGRMQLYPSMLSVPDTGSNVYLPMMTGLPVCRGSALFLVCCPQ